MTFPPLDLQGYLLVAQGVVFVLFLLIALILFFKKAPVEEPKLEEAPKPLAPPPTPPEIKSILEKVNAVEAQLGKLATQLAAPPKMPPPGLNDKLAVELKTIGEKLGAIESEMSKQVEALRASLTAPAAAVADPASAPTPEAVPAAVAVPAAAAAVPEGEAVKDPMDALLSGFDPTAQKT